MVTLSFLDVKTIYGYSGISRPLDDIPKSQFPQKNCTVALFIASTLTLIYTISFFLNGLPLYVCTIKFFE